MTSSFCKQIEPCARNGFPVRPPAAATGNASSPIPRTIGEKSTLDRMLEHETPAASFNALIADEDGEASLQLRDCLAKADRERKCIRRALFLMVALFTISLAGLSYCAVLLPQGLLSPGHLVTNTLSLLGLVSLIAQLEFFGYLLWHRVAVNRLHEECRRRGLLLAESQPRN